MTAGRMAARMGRLAGAHRRAASDAEARRLAAYLGIFASELWAEVAEADRICRAAGAVAAEARVAAVPRDLEVPADELRQEVEHLRAEAVDAAD